MIPDSKFHHLSPLGQRLRLFRFAYVQIDPHDPLDEDCCFSSPQWTGSEHLRKQWRNILGPLNPIRRLSSSPVCSNSIRALHEVRKSQPNRPLILCQTPFEPIFPGSRLQGLVCSEKWVTPALWNSDSTDVLFWGQKPHDPNTMRIEPFLSFASHPLKDLWHRLKIKHDPEIFPNRFGLREDGRIEVQLPLFGEHTNCDTSLSKHLQTVHDASFSAALNPPKRRIYVFSRSAPILAWFARDVVRLLGPSFHALLFPQHPDPRDPQSFFVLINDRAIPFARLSRSYQSIHLDWNSRSIAYRRYRMSPQNNASWHSLRTPLARAQLAHRGFIWTFFKTARGWQSYLGSRETAIDQTRTFRNRLQCWRAFHDR